MGIIQTYIIHYARPLSEVTLDNATKAMPGLGSRVVRSAMTAVNLKGEGNFIRRQVKKGDQEGCRDRRA